MPKEEHIDSLSRKVIKIVGITAIMTLLILLIIKGFKVLLLILAGLLLSIFFRGIALHLRSWFPINEAVSLIISILFVIGVITAGSLLLSPRISSQMETLNKEIPKAADKAKQKVQGTMVGDFIIDRANNFLQSNGVNNDGSSAGESGNTAKSGSKTDESGKKESVSSAGGPSTLQDKILSFFNSVFGVIGDLYIIFFLGMFFMAQPAVYRNAITSLFPQKNRERAEQVLQTIAYTLKRWLLGKLLSMLIVGVLTSIGLTLLGIPMALTLGVFAGLISFIPNFGPLLSFIPAGLMAVVEGFDYVLYTAFLYIGVQAIESNLINPLIQRNMISFPMAAILIAQVILAVFTGALGIILAVPVVAIVSVLVKMLYLEDVLEDNDVKVKGEKKFS